MMYKNTYDRLAISVIESYTAKLENEPPVFERDTFESLEKSFMRIGKLLTDELERKDHATNS